MKYTKSNKTHLKLAFNYLARWPTNICEFIDSSIAILLTILFIGAAYAETPSPDTRWVQIVEGSNLMYDGNGTTLKVLNDKAETDGVNTYLNEERWNGFLKKYMESLPLNMRDATLRTLMHSYVKYDDLENEIVFRTAIGPKEVFGEERGEIYYFGTIKNKKAEAQIEFRYRTSLRMAYKTSNGPIGLNRIKIYTDDTQFEPKLVFNRTCQMGAESECALMPLNNNENLLIAQTIASGKKSVIRYYGSNRSYDYILSDSNKNSLKLAIKSLVEINSQ